MSLPEVPEFDTYCIHCGRKNELHSNVDGAYPAPGDISICWLCGGASAFDEDLKLVPLTVEQAEELEKDVVVKKG